MTSPSEPDVTEAPVPFAVVDGTLCIGGRPIPWAQIFREDQLIPSSRSQPFLIRRARIPFENGWAISVVWGSASYSSNHGHPIERVEFTETPATVEVAVVRRDELVGDPQGYVSADKVLALIGQVATWPSDGDILGVFCSGEEPS